VVGDAARCCEAVTLRVGRRRRGRPCWTPGAARRKAPLVHLGLALCLGSEADPDGVCRLHEMEQHVRACAWLRPFEMLAAVVRRPLDHPCDANVGARA